MKENSICMFFSSLSYYVQEGRSCGDDGLLKIVFMIPRTHIYICFQYLPIVIDNMGYYGSKNNQLVVQEE